MKNYLLLFIVNIQAVWIAYLFYDKHYLHKILHTVMKNDSFADIIVSKNITEGFTTSVFCTGATKDDRECRFQHLCFDPSINKYLFFHSNQTRLYGVPYNSSKYVLLDLSSVNDHNSKYFSHVDVVAEMYGSRDVDYVTGHSILFHRFNPENIMHVIHDDLLPWFHTKRKYFPTVDPVNAIMLDGRDAGPYFDLYGLFMDPVITAQNVTKLTCFQDVIVGVSKTTTWYQYGFYSPQGPVHVNNYPSSEIHYFVQDIKSRLQILPPVVEEEEKMRKTSFNDCVVFISRKTTRKIVNEMDFILRLSSYFGMPVHMVDLQFDQFDEIVAQISKARVLISVHGAQLILSLFLPQQATVIEIFPFGIPAENYTPYKTLAALMNFNYIAWENKIESNTYPHPDWPPNVGGIVHLPKELQVKIAETKIVPKHLCCHDPFWLYRIYQDTRVDTTYFFNFISDRMDKTAEVCSSNELSFFYPDMITECTCRLTSKGDIQVTWGVPWNVEWVDKTSLAYEIILTSGEESSQTVHFVTGEEVFHFNNISCSVCFVQIRCIFYELKGDLSEKISCVS